MLFDSGEDVLPDIGLTADALAATDPALLKPNPPAWLDCVAGDVWRAAS
ncbi:MAG TPA: hypothetical protein VGM32_10265 [Rhodopila sp.]